MPTPSRELTQIVEYRGIRGLVAAEILNDTESLYETGPVFAIAGVAEATKTTDVSTDKHFYDNRAAIIITSAATNTIAFNVSAIPLDVLAYINGQYYDSDNEALIESQPEVRYFAVGYITKDTDGVERYIWHYRGTFSPVDETNSTENESTDANGQTLVFNGVDTVHKWTVGDKTKPVKSLVLKEGDLTDEDTFFAVVTTPDMISSGSTPTFPVVILNGATSTATVKRGTTTLTSGTPVAAGTVLTVTVAPPAASIKVNDRTVESGSTFVVGGSTVVQAIDD